VNRGLERADPNAGGFGFQPIGRLSYGRLVWRAMALVAGGLVLVVFGIAYLRWPSMFRRGVWLKTSIAIRSLSEDGYVTFMRVLGALSIVAGIVVALVGAIRAT
jgi:uncharacterized protein YjeT (DUF2065 family)